MACVFQLQGDDWQSDRSMLDCNRYMLEHRVATDLTFIITAADGSASQILAHRYVLISRSAIFHSILCADGGDQIHEIQVADIPATVLEKLLRFMYYEDTNFGPEWAPSVLYAARKYRVGTLERHCIKLLEGCIGNTHNGNNNNLVSTEVPAAVLTSPPEMEPPAPPPSAHVIPAPLLPAHAQHVQVLTHLQAQPATPAQQQLQALQNSQMKVITQSTVQPAPTHVLTPRSQTPVASSQPMAIHRNSVDLDPASKETTFASTGVLEHAIQAITVHEMSPNNHVSKGIKRPLDSNSAPRPVKVAATLSTEALLPQTVTFVGQASTPSTVQWVASNSENTTPKMTLGVADDGGTTSSPQQQPAVAPPRGLSPIPPGIYSMPTQEQVEAAKAIAKQDRARNVTHAPGLVPVRTVGPSYFQCPYCDAKFTRSPNTSSQRPLTPSTKQGLSSPTIDFNLMSNLISTSDDSPVRLENSALLSMQEKQSKPNAMIQLLQQPSMPEQSMIPQNPALTLTGYINNFKQKIADKTPSASISAAGLSSGGAMLLSPTVTNGAKSSGVTEIAAILTPSAPISSAPIVSAKVTPSPPKYPGPHRAMMTPHAASRMSGVHTPPNPTAGMSFTPKMASPKIFQQPTSSPASPTISNKSAASVTLEDASTLPLDGSIVSITTEMPTIDLSHGTVMSTLGPGVLDLGLASLNHETEALRSIASDASSSVSNGVN